MRHPYNYGLPDRVASRLGRDPYTCRHVTRSARILRTIDPRPCGDCVSSVTDAGPSIFDPEPVKLAIEVYAREGNDADTQHAGGNRRGPSAPEAVRCVVRQRGRRGTPPVPPAG